MEKFKPTVISKEFISSVTDSVQNQNAISFAESVASSSSLSDDQAMNNNYQKSQSYSRDVTGIVTGYKNADTNTIVANVKVSNQSLSADVKISTIMIFANYNGNKILVATSRLNEPELLPAFDADKGTPVTIELAVYIQVSNVVDAKVQFNDAGLATNSDLQHVDSMSVHNIGNETIDGVKTFTHPIKGVADINVRQLWDGYDLDSLKTAGMYSANNVKVVQSSIKETFSLIVEVSGQFIKQTKSVFNQDGTSSTYIRYYNSKWSDFKKFTIDDSQIANINEQNEFKENAVFDKNVTVGGALHANADWSHNSEHAINADNATHAANADNSGHADNASHADRTMLADYVMRENDQVMNSLKLNGNLDVNGDTITQKLDVNGPLFAHQDVTSYSSVVSKKRYVGWSDAWQGFRFWFDRIGNTVTVDVSGLSNVKIDGWVAFSASVPVGYRPAHDTKAVIFVGNQAGFIQVGSDGSLYNGGVWNVLNYDYDKQVRVIGTWTTLDDLPS